MEPKITAQELLDGVEYSQEEQTDLNITKILRKNKTIDKYKTKIDEFLKNNCIW